LEVGVLAGFGAILGRSSGAMDRGGVVLIKEEILKSQSRSYCDHGAKQGSFAMAVTSCGVSSSIFPLPFTVWEHVNILAASAFFNLIWCSKKFKKCQWKFEFPMWKILNMNPNFGYCSGSIFKSRSKIFRKKELVI